MSVYEQGDDPEGLLARADEGLYQAKRRREESAAARPGADAVSSEPQQ